MPTPMFIGQQTLQETPESPQWRFSREKGASVTRSFRGAFALAMASRPPLNAFGTGIYAGLRITDVQVTAEKPGIGQLQWTMEGALVGANGDLPELPPDLCVVDNALQEFAIEKHPRYKNLSHDIRSAVKTAIDATDNTLREAALTTITFGVEDPTTGIPREQELFDKLSQGQSHYALFLPTYAWTIYSLTQPATDPGGYIQLPYGPIPASSQAGMNWLRKADNLEWTGSFWKLVRSWVAGFDIDPLIYPVGV